MPEVAPVASAREPRRAAPKSIRGARRGPTLDEVAAHAGVSRSVASRAMNHASHVSQAKRDAVLRSAKELGYAPNATARALATSKVGSVALVVGNEDPTSFGAPFFSQIIVGIATALAKAELDLTLLMAAADTESRLERLLRSRRADGVMLMATHGDDPLLRVTAGADIPVVFCGRPLTEEPRWYVDADNRGGARTAVEHLLNSGRRRIGTITGPMDLEASVARYRGFADALALQGLDSHWAEEADFTHDGGVRAMRRLLDAHPDLDAVFAASDNMAAGAIRALQASGRAVPEDVAVIGFDDLGTAAQTDPPLTTVSQPLGALGHETASMLVRLIAGEDPSPIILPTRLVVRASAPGPVRDD